MNKRIVKTILRNSFLLLYLNYRAKRFVKKKTASFEERYTYAVKYLKKYNHDMNVKIHTYGLENIPSDIKGCIFIGNHQGKNDGATILQALEKTPASFLIADDESHYFLYGNVCEMLEAKRIIFDDLYSQAKIYREMGEELSEGHRFIVFPEAGYVDNKNTLREFHSATFAPAYRAKAPIIPFCLYDTWKVYHPDYKDGKPLDTECHILKPILYEEYKSLSKAELTQFVKAKIQEKMDEIIKSKQ